MKNKLLLLAAVATLVLPAASAETDKWTDFVITENENRILYKNYQPTANISQDAIAFLKICLHPGSPAVDIADGVPSAEGLIRLSIGAEKGGRCILASTRREIRLIGSNTDPENKVYEAYGRWKVVDIVG